MPISPSLPPEDGAALAWFGGRLATKLIELRTADTPDDVSRLLTEMEQKGGWWAVVATYEGALTAARFADVRAADLPLASAPWAGVPREGWTTSLDRAQYVAACHQVRERIGRGEVYQVNICRVLEHPLPAPADLLALAHRVRVGNPAPYEGFVRLPGLEVVCASPELFLARDGAQVSTGPIKGTATTEDRMLAKDVDENIMIVDLARNDLSMVAKPGSVQASDLLALERHPGLVHLVSRVRATLAPGVGWPALWAATTPPASVTGAPKFTALQAIMDLERSARGPYCGPIGWVDIDAGTAQLAVGIRTFWAMTSAGRRVLRFGTGAGITWRSDPEQEWAETELKAHRLLRLCGLEHSV